MFNTDTNRSTACRDLSQVRWCGIPLDNLGPHGLGGQMRFADWLALRFFLRARTLHCKARGKQQANSMDFNF